MKLLKDFHFHFVVLTVAIPTLPQFSTYLPKPFIEISLIILGAILLVIKEYQTKQAYKEGSAGLVGSKYK
jgi:hypothetical protein